MKIVGYSVNYKTLQKNFVPKFHSEKKVSSTLPYWSFTELKYVWTWKKTLVCNRWKENSCLGTVQQLEKKTLHIDTYTISLLKKRTLELMEILEEYVEYC